MSRFKQGSPISCFLIATLLSTALLSGGCHAPNNFVPGDDTELEGEGPDSGDGGDFPIECLDPLLSAAFTAVTLALGLEPALIDKLPNHIIFDQIFETVTVAPDVEFCPETEVSEVDGNLATVVIPGETGECVADVDQTKVGLVSELFEFALECTDFGAPMTDPLVTIDGLMGFSLFILDPLLDGGHIEFIFESEDLMLECDGETCPVNLNFSIVVERIAHFLIVWINGCITRCDETFAVFGTTKVVLGDGGIGDGGEGDGGGEVDGEGDGGGEVDGEIDGGEEEAAEIEVET